MGCLSLWQFIRPTETGGTSSGDRPVISEWGVCVVLNLCKVRPREKEQSLVVSVLLVLGIFR
jgi:hypothetical protein